MSAAVHAAAAATDRSRRTPVAAAASATSATSAPPHWARTLASLDAARAYAFAALDDAELVDVYAPASPLLARDGKTIRELRAHRLHVHGPLPSLEFVGTIRGSASAVTLVVRETAATYEIVDAAGHVVRRGGNTTAGRFELSLVRVGQRWLVESVTPVVGGTYGGGPSR